MEAFREVAGIAAQADRSSSAAAHAP